MITPDDVLATYPEIEKFDSELIKQWTETANAAIFEARVKEPRAIEQMRILFVMHHLTRPQTVDLAAPHVRARASFPGRMAGHVRVRHPWEGTRYGHDLIFGMRA